MDIIESLRKNIPYEEFDYQVLTGSLEGYSFPRNKIRDLLGKGVIIRVKKGLYVFGNSYRQNPYSREILANLIYGPSCISMEYALQYHGLIPEHSVALTSVTTKRAKKFQTPLGLYLYNNVPAVGFHLGMDRIEMKDGRAFLMASPEKALADKFRADRGLKIRTQKECFEYLTESLRVEEGDLANLDAYILDRLGGAYKSKRIHLLSGLIRRLKKRSG